MNEYTFTLRYKLRAKNKQEASRANEDILKALPKNTYSASIAETLQEDLLDN